MTGRITMLGISRWTRKGGSYRTIQRFFKKKIDWMQIFWSIIKTHLIEKDEPIILAGDTTVVTKAGKKTHGLGWFFSSTHNKAIHCLSFQVISIISTKTGRSFPIAIEKLKYAPKKKEKELEKPKIKRGRGIPKIYGDKIDYIDIPAKYLVQSKSDETELIRHYRFTARHKRFADPLNIVLILKTDLKTKKTAKMILFSTDLNLSCENMIRYYRLRFQIEFNFRDAKQHFGLEDFMVLSEESVSNATHLSFYCLNLSQVLMQKTGEKSIIDLKFRYHEHYYATQILKIVSNRGFSIKKHEILEEIPIFGSIHRRKNIA